MAVIPVSFIWLGVVLIFRVKSFKVLASVEHDCKRLEEFARTQHDGSAPKLFESEASCQLKPKECEARLKEGVSQAVENGKELVLMFETNFQSLKDVEAVQAAVKAVRYRIGALETALTTHKTSPNVRFAAYQLSAAVDALVRQARFVSVAEM